MMGAGELGVAEEGESPHESAGGTRKPGPRVGVKLTAKSKTYAKLLHDGGMSSIELQRETSATSSDSGVTPASRSGFRSSTSEVDPFDAVFPSQRAAQTNNPDVAQCRQGNPNI